MSFKNVQVPLSKLDTTNVGSSVDGPSSALSTSSVKYSPIYVVINEYTKRMQDELDIKPGDKVQVITDDGEYNDGWYYGKNLRTNEEGLFPVIFTQQMTFPPKMGSTRIKHSKRSGSIGREDSSVSINESGSETSTPRVIETAAPMVVQQKKTLNRQASVKNTMSDIDKALQELKNDSFEDRDVETRNRDSVISATNHLDFGKASESPKAAKSPVSREMITNTINGIEGSELDPKKAERWTPQQVTAYFISRGFDVQSSSKFQQHRISGAILLELELGHLKELDIDSFGTRFEIFKELDALRERVGRVNKDNRNRDLWSTSLGSSSKKMSMADNNNTGGMNYKAKGLTAPVFLNGGPAYKGRMARKISHSQENNDQLDSRNAANLNNDVASTKHRPPSFGTHFESAMSSANIVNADITDSELFSSPRRAPKPPSYPSPVAPRKSPGGNMTVGHSGVGYSPPTIYEKKSPSVESNYSDPPSRKAHLSKGEDSSVGTLLTSNRHEDSFVSGPKFRSTEERPAAEQQNPSPDGNRKIGLGLASSTLAASQPSSHTWNNIDPFSSRKSGINSNRSSNNHKNFNNGSSPRADHKPSLSGASFIDLLNKVSHKNTSFEEFGGEHTSNSVGELQNRPTSSIYMSHSEGHSAQGQSDYSDVRGDSGSYFSNKEDDDSSSTPVNLSLGMLPSKGKDIGNGTISIAAKQTLDEGSQAIPVEISRAKSAMHTPAAVTHSSPAKSKPASSPAKSKPASSPAKSKPASSPAKSKVSRVETERRSVSARDSSTLGKNKTALEEDKKKRSVSEAVKSTAMFGMNSKGSFRKRQTSAFMEGIRNITVEQAMVDADCSGWMSKKGSGTMGTWKTRFFALHGTRLSYFSSANDTRERGLIDVTAHCVVPAKEDDKLVSLYAASTGKGRYCFKLIPPHPGSKKGLTFTQPRVHYFAVDNKNDMRAWMAALIKTTIDVDTSVPVISSCTTTTISLNRAQEMFLQAREETRLREQQYLNEEDEDQLLWEKEQQGNNDEDIPGSATTNPSSNTSINMASTGFASPYLLASGMLSPSIHRSGTGRSAKSGDKTPEKIRELEAYGAERI